MDDPDRFIYKTVQSDAIFSLAATKWISDWKLMEMSAFPYTLYLPAWSWELLHIYFTYSLADIM